MSCADSLECQVAYLEPSTFTLNHVREGTLFPTCICAQLLGSFASPSLELSCSKAPTLTTSKARTTSVLRKTASMMSYHNNQLTMIGLESEDEEHSYPTPRSNKRKRDRTFVMTAPTENSYPAGRGSVHEDQAQYFSTVGAQDLDTYDFPFDHWPMAPFAEAHGQFSGDWDLNDCSFDPAATNGTAYPMEPENDPERFTSPHYNSAATTGVGFAASQGSNLNEAAGSDSYLTSISTPVAENTMVAEDNIDFEHNMTAQDNPFLDPPNAHDNPFRDPSSEDDNPFRDPSNADYDFQETRVKDEETEDEVEVSLTPFGENEFDESDYEDRRPAKVPKLNKDGVPRKPRQPRPKLLKWQDDDWKRVCLGIVWACGDSGIQIPFEQASHVVSESCTAGALQQALLKLRGKQIAEGHQIPPLKMAWTRKGRNATPVKTNANTSTSQGTLKRKPTRVASGQACLVRLRRPYREADRQHLAQPYTFTGKLHVGPLVSAPAATDMSMPLVVYSSYVPYVNPLAPAPAAPTPAAPAPPTPSRWQRPPSWNIVPRPELIGPVSPARRYSALIPTPSSFAAPITPAGYQHHRRSTAVSALESFIKGSDTSASKPIEKSDSDPMVTNDHMHDVVTPVKTMDPGSDSEDSGCLDGVARKTREFTAKSKAKGKRAMKDIKRHTNYQGVRSYFDDKIFRKEDRNGPGGSGGGITT
ncbi:hypothetical protein DE146DRAFT_759327 [Phaeosphaeria sp. MPI-PUGE-AT-0046c]|nr:hypothetical protein DE146DRAFT_759327 [Phaeosphaeria sp. MPI-PUGE-AT-0046c]